MLISEQYKKRLQELAGIITEITDEERRQSFAASDKRVAFRRDLMAAAINQGREIGILFQTNNEKDKMPISKFRIIYILNNGITLTSNHLTMNRNPVRYSFYH